MNSLPASGFNAGSNRHLPFLKSLLSNLSVYFTGFIARHTNYPTIASPTFTLLTWIDLTTTSFQSLVLSGPNSNTYPTLTMPEVIKPPAMYPIPLTLKCSHTCI